MSRKARGEKRKIRIATSKHKFFKSTLLEMKKVLSDYESEWLRDRQIILNSFGSKKDNESQIDKNIVKIYPSQKEKKNISNDDLFTLQSESKSHPQWAKKLYKKIARKTHPDSNIDSPDSEDLEKIFQNAANIMNKGDYDTLVDIAIDMGMNADIESRILSEKLQKRIACIKKEIQEIEEGIIWIWGESFGILEIRSKIIEEFLKKSNINIPNHGLIEKMILKIEEE